MAVWIGGAAWLAWIVAGFIALAGVANIMMIPHPLWMQIAAVAAPLPAGWLASRSSRPKVAV